MATQKKNFAKSPDISKVMDPSTIENFINGKKNEPNEPIQTTSEMKEKTKPMQTQEKHHVSMDKTKVQHICRLPIGLKKALDYLGKTTYDESMNSICIDGITHRVRELAEQNGYELPEDFGNWTKN